MARAVETLRKQKFEIEAPEAEKVLLVGDFTQWQQKPLPMRKGRDGIWSITIDLAVGPHSYRFIVDGEWCDDPECTQRVPNPYGGQDMVRKVV